MDFEWERGPSLGAQDGGGGDKMGGQHYSTTAPMEGTKWQGTTSQLNSPDGNAGS